MHADIRRRLLERKMDMVHNTRLAIIIREYDCVEARLLSDKHKMAALRGKVAAMGAGKT